MNSRTWTSSGVAVLYPWCRWWVTHSRRPTCVAFAWSIMGTKMTSSTKPDVLTYPNAKGPKHEIWWSLYIWFLKYARGQTGRYIYTDTLIAIHRSQSHTEGGIVHGRTSTWSCHCSRRAASNCFIFCSTVNSVPPCLLLPAAPVPAAAAAGGRVTAAGSTLMPWASRSALWL